MAEKRIIPASELIINDDGSAFHIHVRPDQLRDKIILVGDPGRVSMVAEYFDTIDYDVQSREFHAIGGTYKGKPLMCISHGIGSDNIEIVLTELDALANVDFKTREVRPEHRTLEMVRVGTSGSLQTDIHIGDFVIANRGIGTDGIINYYAERPEICDLDFEKKLTEYTGWLPIWAYPYAVNANPELVERIGRDDMLRGNTMSAVGFYAPQGRMVRLKLAKPDLVEKLESFGYEGERITNFEMESGCLQGMAKMLGHKAMTVCCIIAERRSTNADPDYKPHVRRLIETVLDRI
ncbi:MAG: nucleoside phosphorylase [Muribaculaceae bacterium]|jgi:uridine phosphorylase|nr:nucleoside phosphorylase [Muribaculaceae bacterium]